MLESYRIRYAFSRTLSFEKEYASKDWTYLDEDDEYYNVKIGY